MARVFANYTPEQLITLSVIMSVILSREYDVADQVILCDLLSAVSTNLSFIIDQKSYLEELLENDLESEEEGEEEGEEK